MQAEDGKVPGPYSEVICPSVIVQPQTGAVRCGGIVSIHTPQHTHTHTHTHTHPPKHTMLFYSTDLMQLGWEVREVLSEKIHQ